MNIDLEDDTSVSPLVTSTVSGDTKGLAELTIHCENSAALAAIVANPKAITFLRPMWYTGYSSENELNPDVLTPENKKSTSLFRHHTLKSNREPARRIFLRPIPIKAGLCFSTGKISILKTVIIIL